MKTKASTARMFSPARRWRDYRFSGVGAVVVMVCLLVAAPALTGQTVLNDIERTETVHFWPDLYLNGGDTLYCRQPFTTRLGLTMSHVYAEAWVSYSLDCGSVAQCRSGVLAFAYIESDLHNLFPARLGTDDARGQLPFGFVPGDRRDFGSDCVFKVDPARGLAQPPVPARGDIARAILYMMWEYGLPLPRLMTRDLLREWNRQDPVDASERQRNDRIAVIQGNRNPFVDTPELADRF